MRDFDTCYFEKTEGFFAQKLQILTGDLDYSPYSCCLILVHNGGFVPSDSYAGPFPVYNEGSTMTDSSGKIKIFRTYNIILIFVGFIIKFWQNTVTVNFFSLSSLLSPPLPTFHK